MEVTHRENVRRKYRVSGLSSQPTKELMYYMICFLSCILINHQCYIMLGLYAVLLAFFLPCRFPVDEHMNMKSVIEYFQEVYGFTIQYAHLPCLQVGNQKKVNYLPMEVCYETN